MINKKLKRLLKKSKGTKTVYGISKTLGVSPQAGDYVVKQKDLAKDFAGAAEAAMNLCGGTLGVSTLKMVSPLSLFTIFGIFYIADCWRDCWELAWKRHFKICENLEKLSFGPSKIMAQGL